LKKKDRKAARATQRTRSLATPSAISHRVQSLLPPNEGNDDLERIDRELRFDESFKVSLFNEQEILDALLMDRSGPIDHRRKATTIAEQIRPRRAEDSVGVVGLQQKLTDSILDILRTDHQEDLETRKRRISYANWVMTKRGGGKFLERKRVGPSF
jgi:hypothetical protein